MLLVWISHRFTLRLKRSTPTLLTMDTLAKVTKIKDEKKDTFKSKEVLKNIIADFQYLLKLFTKLSDAADKADDKATTAFADDNIAILEKELWMLGSMLK